MRDLIRLITKNPHNFDYDKKCVCYFFEDIINGTKTSFSNILIDKKLYENISVYNILNKTTTCPKPLCIKFDKIGGLLYHLMVKLSIWCYLIMDCLTKFVITLNLLSKKVILQIVLTTILGRSELIHIILCLFKKYWLFIMF